MFQNHPKLWTWTFFKQLKCNLNITEKIQNTNENKDVMLNNAESQESDVFIEVFARVS